MKPLRRLARLAEVALGLGLAASSATAGDFEFMGGLSSASLTGTAVGGGGARSGVSVGVQARWPLASRWMFGTGIAYVERGMVVGDATYLGPAGAGTVQETIELAYAEVPLLVSWCSPVRSGARVLLFAGPLLAVKMSEWLHQTGVQELKLRRSDFQDSDALGCAGARIELEFPKRYLFAEARVDAGLLNELRPAAASGTARTTGLRVLAGYGWIGPR